MSAPTAAEPVVRAVLPGPGTVELSALLPALTATPTLRPFGPEVTAFCTDLSRALGRRTRHMPEVQALAYFVRRSAVARMAASFAELGDDSTLLVPRGTVFHIPPANVDTVFVYSWLLSVLCGNRNVVRLSDRVSAQTELLVDVVGEQLAEHPAVRDTTAMIRYGHDRAATDALSRACDVRVIWGGDATVDAVRRSSLAPHADELTFSDRTSMAAIEGNAYAALGPSDRDALAHEFYNDTYWFDQLGCSSPRVVVWVGDAPTCAAGAEDFFARLARKVEERGYRVDAAGALAKLGFGYRTVLDQPVTAYGSYGNELAVLSVDRFPEAGADFCGGGLFLQHRVPELGALVEHVDRKVQTLTHHGFEPAELRALAVALNGRGIDRIVPIGQALAFGRVWDGYDLLQSFTRRVVVSS